MSNHYETPENNVKVAALNLMRHKILINIGKGFSYPGLDLDDINEIFIVAGLPVVVPEEVKAKELKVIDFETKEDEATE